MADSPLKFPRHESVDLTYQSRPISFATPVLFSAFVALAVATFEWPARWLLSGTPVFTFFILLGAAEGYRILPIVPLWTLLATTNLAYAVAATSWLLYGALSALMYPAIFFTCLFQFDLVARYVRRVLRKVIRQLHFVQDTIAFFDIPALEIDVDVEGLMVVRGITFSLSSLTVVAHGIEVIIKLPHDIELAIATETVTIPLLRRVEISDCFINVKGGRDMDFREVGDEDKTSDDDGFVLEATPLLQAAARQKHLSRPEFKQTRSQWARGTKMQDSDVKGVYRSMRKISPEDQSATDQYRKTIRWIGETNTIQQCKREVEKEAAGLESKEDLRAAICSKMQPKPSLAHPPKRSIRVTTLQNLPPPRVRQTLHRMPMLLRLILNPISYFHPVSISSITAASSGRWIAYLLKTHLLKEYAKDNKELRSLEKRMVSWLGDANFIFELADIKGIASVPFLPNFDIMTVLKFDDVMAFRSLEKEVSLEQVIRIGGADASFTIPSYLLPHHEHLLPPKPSAKDTQQLSDDIDEADSKPKKVQAERKLEQAEDDETNVKISAHVQLPAVFSQELLNFIAALVKATKVVELEKEPGAMDGHMSNIKELGSALSKSMKDGVKKTVVDGIISDKWIAKMVGKVTKMLEEAQGDVGYSGDIPVKLEVYRLPEGHPEMSKLLA